MLLGDDEVECGATGMPGTSKVRRFTVSLDEPDYNELKCIADSQRPLLSLQYVVRYESQRFLDEHKGNQFVLDIE